MTKRTLTELLRRDLAEFAFKPGARGQLRLEAARGHDGLVATALAGLAADLGAFHIALKPKPLPLTCDDTNGRRFDLQK